MDVCLKADEVEAFVAGSLSNDENSRVEEHVASCAACQKAVESCRRDAELADGIQDAYGELTVLNSVPSCPSASDAELIIDSIEGYQILHEIHRGGQGVVYKAVQLATKRTVALKVLLHGVHASHKQRQRFEREIDLVAGMQHPNIVTIYDSGLTQGHHYFAMEYVHGRRLDEYVLAANLSIKEILRLFEKICMAVNFAHQRGVIHRDLKPSNICVDADGEPRVLDFGLAKSAGSDVGEGLPVTVPGDFMGTPAYASPEQVSGDPRLVDIRTDVYSLGVILYEMLTGAYPYEVSGPVVEVFRNIAEAEPKRPSAIRAEIDNEVETIVLQSLAKERERRYQSAGNLARDVGRYLRGEPLDAKRDSTWYVVRKSLRRYRAAASIAVAFVLVLAMSTIALSIMYQNQSRARADAEASRIAESEQRSLAEKRAEELEIVTEFQQSMISEIDAQAMGRALYADMEFRVRESMESAVVSEDAREEAVGRFVTTLRRTNATDAALKLVDEQMLRRAVKAIEADFVDRPVIRAALQQTVADTYREIGRFGPAMPLQESALGARRKELGNGHPDTLYSLNSMGRLLMEMGKYPEALVYCEEALEGRRRVLGNDHRATLISIGDLALLLLKMGKFEESHRYHVEALEGRRRTLGDDHEEVISALINMADVLKELARNDEALDYYLQAFERGRRVLGNDHPDTLIARTNIAKEFQYRGEFKEAMAHKKEALAGWRRTLGDDHPNTLVAFTNLGTLFIAMGDLESALGEFREALEGWRRVVGDEHPNTLTTVAYVGVVLQKLGRTEEAEPYFRESLEGQRRVLGDNHHHTMVATHNMGKLLCTLGKLEEAEQHGAKAVRWAKENLSEGHGTTAAFLHGYGSTLVMLERFGEAEATLLESHAIELQSQGGAGRYADKAARALVKCYEGWHLKEPDGGYDAKAEQWRAKLEKSKESGQ